MCSGCVSVWHFLENSLSQHKPLNHRPPSQPDLPLAHWHRLGGPQCTVQAGSSACVCDVGRVGQGVGGEGVGEALVDVKAPSTL
eukprot:1519432-Rhodomonas_salina.2